MRKLIALVFLAAAAAACGSDSSSSTPGAPPPPDVRTRDVGYEHGGTLLQGMMAWDQNATVKRPGVLVVHEWWGHDEHARNQAKRLAEAGYVALAVDMYGDGKHATHPDDAQKFMTEATKDPAVAVARFNAARAALVADPRVDPDRIAAIGYCFGGAVVLNMARAGHDLDAVVSFHGALQPAFTAQPGGIKPEILVLTGADDPMVPADLVESFKKEMTDARATFRVISYPGAKHSFTNPKAESHGMPALGYNADADKKSWEEMVGLFKRIFG